MDPKLIKAHNQTAFPKSLVFYSPIKIYTRENGLHFVHLPDYSSLKLFIYFHVEKIGKHTVLSLISAQWKDAHWSTNFHRFAEVGKVTRRVRDRKEWGKVMPGLAVGMELDSLDNKLVACQCYNVFCLYHCQSHCPCSYMLLQPCHSSAWILGSCFHRCGLDVIQSTNGLFSLQELQHNLKQNTTSVAIGMGPAYCFMPDLRTSSTVQAISGITANQGCHIVYRL